jgi:hypothetical protein
MNSTMNGTEARLANVVLSHQRLQQQQSQDPEQHLEKPATQPAQQPQTPQQQQQLPAGGPMGANCVSPVHFWKNCIHREPEQQNGRCSVVNKLPAGPLTPFFPQPGVKNNRHYKGVMGKATNTGSRPVDMWFKAAQTLVATQLNELSGVVLPQTVMDAVSLIGSVVGTTSTTPPSINMQLPGLAPAINLLEMFNSGQVSFDRAWPISCCWSTWPVPWFLSHSPCDNQQLGLPPTLVATAALHAHKSTHFVQFLCLTSATCCAACVQAGVEPC